AGIQFHVGRAIVAESEKFQVVAGIKTPVLLACNEDVHLHAAVVESDGARVYGADGKSCALEVGVREAIQGVLGGRDLVVFLVKLDPLVRLGDRLETEKAENQQKIGPPHLWRMLTVYTHRNPKVSKPKIFGNDI